MTKILFICHGNICRSPMAEFIMKDLVKKQGIEKDFEISSVATSTEEIGNSVYPPAKAKLTEHGISCKGKTAGQITKSDCEYYDFLIVMDNNNIKNFHRMFGNAYNEKLSMLMDYTERGGEVSDPWYTRNFDRAYDDIYSGCVGFLKNCKK